VFPFNPLADSLRPACPKIMNRPHGRLDFVGIAAVGTAVVGTAACTHHQHSVCVSPG